MPGLSRQVHSSKPVDLDDPHWLTVDQEAGKLHSWPYWAVRQVRGTRLFVTLCPLLLSIPVIVILAAVNPRVPFRFGWNSIDHVADRRPGHDYTASEVTAMAGSDQWLALGTADQGLTLLNKASRVPREAVTAGRVLDVTRGAGTDNFLVLQENQSISQIAPAQWSGRISHQVCLAQPVTPTWPLEFEPAANQVVATALDDRGWLLALKGVGVGRYLFDTTSYGHTLRTRSWQMGTLSDVPLDEARITAGGVWLTLEGGGIRYAERASLTEIVTRSLSTRPILSLDADYRDQWASAVDDQGALWLYPGGESGWSGPFLGHAQEECQLGSLTDITATRVDGPLVWLGGPTGFFVYDSEARHLSCILAYVRVVDLVVRDSESQDSAARQVLVATDMGLYRVDSSDLDVPRQFTVKNLANDPVRAISLSPDSELLVYQVSWESWTGTVLETRALQNPFGTSRTTVLSPELGWQELSMAPTVTGLERLGQDLVFGTSSGAFIYDPDQHIYTDLSRALVAGNETTLSEFSRLRKGESHLLALADSRPHVLRTNLVSPTWINLDPSWDTAPVDLAESAGEIVGLGPDGEIYDYDKEGNESAKIYLAGAASSLNHALDAQNQAIGDLLLSSDNNWKTALLNGEWVVTYDAAIGTMEERRLPSFASPQHVAQLRMLSDDLLYRLDDGQVLSEDGTVVFESNTFPFAPDKVTALAAGPEETILLGGSRGWIAEYDWASGSVQQVGGESLRPGESPVINLQSTERGTFAELADGSLFHTWGAGWSELRGYRRWVTDSSGSAVWALGDGFVARLWLPPDAGPSLWSVQQFSAGIGFKAFVDQAQFAWQMDAERVAFLGPDAQAGVYDALTDTWQEQTMRRLTRPRAFAVGEDALIVLDENRLFRLNQSLEADPIATLPENAKDISIHVEGKMLRVAFVEAESAVLWVWADLWHKTVSTSYRRGSVFPGLDLDPRQVVYAEQGEDAVYLVDTDGSLASYNPVTAEWTLLQPGVPGDSLLGWLSDGSSNRTDLLLQTTRGKIRVIRLLHSCIDRVYEIPVSLDELGNLLEIGGRHCTSQHLPGRLLCSRTAAARLSLRAMGLKPVPLTRVGDRPLLTDGIMHIVRQAGQTTYTLNCQGTWRTMDLQGSGFSTDATQDVILTASGELWGWQGHELINLRPAAEEGGLIPGARSLAFGRPVTGIDSILTGQIRVHYADGDVDIFQETADGELTIAPEIEPSVLASVNLAGYVLDWTWYPTGTLSAAWRDEEFPVWSAESGALAIQDVHDLALTPDGDLLLATSAGLVIRESDDFGVIKILPHDHVPGFVRTPDGRKLLAVMEDGLYKWEREAFMPVDSGMVTVSVPLGPWEWQSHYLDSSDATRTIVSRREGRSRQWTQVALGQWQFKDDMVTHIARNDAGTVAWLVTEDGAWRFDSHTGRLNVPQEDPSSLPDDQFVATSPAVTISYSNSRLIFEPGDGADRPVFEQGRFFFDNNTQLCSYVRSLFTLLPGRAIVRRNPHTPTKITGLWPVPPDLPADVDYRLKPSDHGVLLIALSADPDTHSAWELDLRTQAGEWRAITVQAQRDVEDFKFVRWREIKDGDIRPFIRLDDQSSLELLPDWWSWDRFAWDQVSCAGAVDGDMALLATPLGPIVRTNVEGTTWDTALIGPLTDMAYCATARQSGRPTGVIVGKIEERLYRLVSVGRQGQPVIQEPNADSLLLASTVLKLQREGQDSNRRITWQQEWVPYVLGDEPVRASVVTSRLAYFPPDILVKDGQFIFDIARGAAPLEAAGDNYGNGSTWLTYAGCSDEGNTSSAIALNRLQEDSRTGGSSLVLQDLWPSDVDLQAARATSDRNIVGLYLTSSGESPLFEVAKGRFTGEKVVWQLVPFDQLGDAFRTGDQVTIDVAKMDWTSRPRYIWDPDLPLIVSPEGYPLFASEANGVALAFDILTSLAVDRPRQQFLIGTRGGILRFFYTDDPCSMSLILQAHLLLPPNRLTLTRQDLDVERIRCAPDDRVWIKLGPPARTAVLLGGQRWEVLETDWSATAGAISDVVVNLDGDGFMVNNALYTESNDAWHIGRRSLIDIVDFALDDSSETLWLSTRDNGVFKVVLDALDGEGN
ncbi:MAG: hypothetical protein JXM73_17105 [Anaerolineae bacterium]|nr:hypothetical protein [Anaerolineae bacterium]